jgi:hypothetical protein
MNFPNLSISKRELCARRKAELELTKKIKSFFMENYQVEPPVRVSGSTQKGTALPRAYFGTDIDMAVQSDSKLVERIAYSNDIFEGCPLFTMDFFEKFATAFPKVYFAGHRLSGVHNEWPFDFAIADSEKDKWKWDYNNSRFLEFSKDQVIEAKKFKYFLKTFNLAGSEVNGVVGPALELLTYHYKSLDKILEKIGEIQPVNETFLDHFGTIKFPQQYYDLFPPINDPIHAGLVTSFKFTTPNTYNRLIECAKSRPKSKEDFTKNHNPKFNYSKQVTTDHYKMLAYFLGTQLSGEIFFHLDVLGDKQGLRLYANTNDQQRKLIDGILNSIGKIPYNWDISYDELPKTMQKDLQKKLGVNPRQFTYFVGRPSLPLSNNKTYVPFDFLIRDDCDALIKITSDGQNESR